MGNPEPPLRGKASGWSKAVARRNNDFLMSVDGAELVDQGEPYAISLTFGREKLSHRKPYVMFVKRSFSPSSYGPDPPALAG